MREELIKLISEYLGECDKEWQERLRSCEEYNKGITGPNNLMHPMTVDRGLDGFVTWMKKGKIL